jgi:hypothetical protein
MMDEKKPIKAIVIIDVKDFPKSCPECVFYTKARCIPQGELSTTSLSKRPGCCPLMTAEWYRVFHLQKGA